MSSLGVLLIRSQILFWTQYSDKGFSYLFIRDWTKCPNSSPHGWFLPHGWRHKFYVASRSFQPSDCDVDLFYRRCQPCDVSKWDPLVHHWAHGMEYGAWPSVAVHEIFMRNQARNEASLWLCWSRLLVFCVVTWTMGNGCFCIWRAKCWQFGTGQPTRNGGPEGLRL